MNLVSGKSESPLSPNTTTQKSYIGDSGAISAYESPLPPTTEPYRATCGDTDLLRPGAPYHSLPGNIRKEPAEMFSRPIYASPAPPQNVIYARVCARLYVSHPCCGRGRSSCRGECVSPRL